MHLNVLLLMALIGWSGQAASQENLVGTWRRLPVAETKATTQTLQPGDLVLRADSSFHIEGNAASATTTIPGWHTGNTYTGTWQVHEGRLLTLYLMPKKDNLFLHFKIVAHTAAALVLRSGFNRTDSTRDVHYQRL